MELVGYTCPDCGDYHQWISGYRDDSGQYSLKCPTCGGIERFQNNQQRKVKA